MTNKLPVPIAELPSPSALESKKVLHPEATLTSPSAARHAVQQESRALLEAVVLAAVVPEIETMVRHHGKCSRRNAPHVVKTPKYLLNPVPVGQSTVQIVTAKQIRQKDISYRAITMNGEIIQPDRLSQPFPLWEFTIRVAYSLYH